jgi:hypothetical protein
MRFLKGSQARLILAVFVDSEVVKYFGEWIKHDLLSCLIIPFVVRYCESQRDGLNCKKHL